MDDNYSLLPHNLRFSAANNLLPVVLRRCVRRGVRSWPGNRHLWQYHQHYLDAATSIIQILPDAIMISLTKDKV